MHGTVQRQQGDICLIYKYADTAFWLCRAINNCVIPVGWKIYGVWLLHGNHILIVRIKQFAKISWEYLKLTFCCKEEKSSFVWLF